ncbi:hypothetical protein Lfu02_64960 [Longispora fulva]|uniref:Zn-dependent metalloprotease n=1 Tax=Longispora fulva TaxID=619741 RepID=A0A8J7GJD6_9ACTN|nr:M4 family metallopeptidase [Longispora fulva]MBG6137720.1 Zn-dependent metalloprotease [Longispora fulva]GIG62124.1 hypothetical protein Lfu02_64960 [Longispora fulva]
MALTLSATTTAAATPTDRNLGDARTMAVSAADKAAASGLDALAKGPFEQYTQKNVLPWVNGLFAVDYDRTYRGLPVVGGDAVVLADGQGHVKSTVAATTAKINVPVAPAVTASAAEATSRGQLASVDRVDSSRLVVLIREDNPRLAWETTMTGLTATAPSHLHVWVDAITGKVLSQHDDVTYGTGTGKWNGPNPLTIATTTGSTNSMRDPGRPGLSCGNASGTVFTGPDDVWGNGVGNNIETGCVDALWAAQHEWDMLVNWLGRNGHNGTGGSWPIKVGLADVNAYWDGSSISIGHNNANDWISSMDVVGHEFGHGIDQFTPGGAGSEAGLGEGTGDIFGALTEAYTNEPAAYDEPDYLVGEEINLVGTGPIRNMYNPSLVDGDPNCYSSSIPSTEVHAAAGPLNHWFYLMAEGTNPAGGPVSPTCNSTTLTGMGIQNAGKIFYGAMLTKTSSQTYKKYRTGTLTAAKNLDSTCGLFNKTKAAWDAISVPAQTADPTCTSTPTNDFSMALSPTSGSVNQGASVTSTVSTTTTSGSAQTVNLTASGAPSGVTVSFSPSSVTSGNSSTMTVAASATAAAGTYTITVTGAGTATHTATYSLTVNGTTPTNDFSVSVSPNSGTVTAGGSTTTTVGTATTSGSAQTVALSASGLPAGATASFSPSSVTSGNSSTLTIATAGSTAAGTYTVTITGTGSVAHSTTYTLTVNGTGGCTSPGQKILNPGFESGSASWTATSGVIGANTGNGSPRTGTQSAWLDGYGSTHTDTLSQSISIPAGCSTYTLSFYLKISTAETTTTVQYDKLTVTVGSTTLATYSNLNPAGYTLRSFNVAAFAGQTVTLKFSGTEDSSLQTSFVIDDTALTVS